MEKGNLLLCDIEIGKGLDGDILRGGFIRITDPMEKPPKKYYWLLPYTMGDTMEHFIMGLNDLATQLKVYMELEEKC